MKFTLREDMAIVRNANKRSLDYIELIVGHPKSEIKIRIEFLFSDAGKERLEKARKAIDGEKQRRMKLHLKAKQSVRTEYSSISKERDHGKPIIDTDRTPKTHIEKSYIKGTLQSEYLAMRERNKV